MQPEWYSQSHVSKLFPKLPETIGSLLNVCRSVKNIEVIHIRASYSKHNDNINNEDWSKWIDHFEELNPEKQCTGVDGSESVEPFAKEIEGEKLFLKPTFDAFNGTELQTYLKARHVERTFIAGLITSVCVQATACSAFCRGYNVSLIEDCCGDRSLERHQAALMLYENYMYKVLSSEDVVNEFLVN
jgi:nicotinamidase-related amidase